MENLFIHLINNKLENSTGGGGAFSILSKIKSPFRGFIVSFPTSFLDLENALPRVGCQTADTDLPSAFWQPATRRSGRFYQRVDQSVPCDRYSSFNKRSEPEGEDPWSCIASEERGGNGAQRPRSGDSRKDSSNHRGGNGTESTSGQQGRSEGRQQEGGGRGQQTSGSRQQESSRQISEDMSWEFTINEAPIARLESLDELDQDHGS